MTLSHALTFESNPDFLNPACCIVPDLIFLNQFKTEYVTFAG